MQNLLFIFILIGFAHWGQHILQCNDCTSFWNRTVVGLGVFILEGITFTFGWPLTLMSYIRSWNKAPESFEPGDFIAIRLERGENESDEDFNKRMEQELARKLMIFRKGQKNGEQ